MFRVIFVNPDGTHKPKQFHLFPDLDAVMTERHHSVPVKPMKVMLGLKSFWIMEQDDPENREYNRAASLFTGKDMYGMCAIYKGSDHAATSLSNKEVLYWTYLLDNLRRRENPPQEEEQPTEA